MCIVQKDLDSKKKSNTEYWAVSKDLFAPLCLFISSGCQVPRQLRLLWQNQWDIAGKQRYYINNSILQHVSKTEDNQRRSIL